MRWRWWLNGGRIALANFVTVTILASRINRYRVGSQPSMLDFMLALHGAEQGEVLTARRAWYLARRVTAGLHGRIWESWRKHGGQI